MNFRNKYVLAIDQGTTSSYGAQNEAYKTIY